MRFLNTSSGNSLYEFLDSHISFGVVESSLPSAISSKSFLSAGQQHVCPKIQAPCPCPIFLTRVCLHVTLKGGSILLELCLSPLDQFYHIIILLLFGWVWFGWVLDGFGWVFMGLLSCIQLTCDYFLLYKKLIMCASRCNFFLNVTFIVF